MSKNNYYCLILGIILVIVSLIPMFLLGGNTYVSIHDQLDTEVLTYILRAKHLGESEIPEIMGGLPSSSVIPASFGTLAFYILFEPETAYVLNYAFVQIVSFVGMFLLLYKLNINSSINLFVSVIFSLLPFYSVYGLSVMGQPLFFYACLVLWKKRDVKVFLIGALFALFSSPALIGYTDCLVLGVIVLYLVFKDKNKMLSFLFLLFEILVIYIFFYNDLLLESINPKYVSHRQEMVLSEMPDTEKIIANIWEGGQPHAISNHKELIPWILAVQFTGMIIITYVTQKTKRKILYLVFFVFSAYLIALFYAMFHGHFIVQIRNRVGGSLKSFQFDRFYWLYPAIWFAAWGISMELILNPGLTVTRKQAKTEKIISRIVSIGLCIFMIYTFGIKTWNESVAKKNFDAIREKRNVPVSFNSFYSFSLFDEINHFIGKPQNEYKVASIALYPSVPLFNGFYCIDGYTSNYPLEYKHKFREIIRSELDKNSYIQWYFDDWGNRCYLFVSELGTNYYFTKDDQNSINNLQLNSKAMKEMDCSYILSGLEIKNYSDNNLVYLKTFENDNSPYRIWLYQLQ